MLLDSGNFSDNPTTDGDARTAALLKSMAHMGYQVVNVGERDIRLGYDEFMKRAAEMQFKFVSANVVDRKTGKAVFPSHVVVDAASPDGKSKVRVGVVGAVRFNPVFLKAGPNGGNMVIAEPLPAVRTEVAALKEQGIDVIVLLAALHMDDARRIAQEVPGINFVLGSYGGQVTEAEERVGDTLILYCGNRGQRIGEVRVTLEGQGAQHKVAGSPTLHLLTRDYPYDQEMLDFLGTLRPPAMPGEGPPAEAAPVEPHPAQPPPPPPSPGAGRAGG